MKNWIWVVVIIVVLILGYLGRHQIKSLLSGSTSQPTIVTVATPSPTETASPSASVASNAVFMVQNSPTKGNYLTDPKGMTLYTYDKDTNGVSNCYSACATTWPPYLQTGATSSALPTNISTTKRTDDTVQYTWNGKPLYYYVKDTKPGDITGDGVGGVWHVAKP